jgi:DNA (cytosine-5)-methyltransferase 1
MEVIGSVYTGVTEDFQRGVYPIARCVKAENHDLGVVLMEQRRLGNLYGDDRGTGFAGNVWDKNYISPSLTTMQVGMREPMIVDKQIVAMRGRNPDNPSDRTVGSPTEQRLEANTQGTSNCLTSVQKDNLLLEKPQYRIRKLTPRECGRLMGVSDEDIDKMAAVNSNTQLYKQFGNSIVVDVMCAMFRNLNIEQE